MDIAFDCGERLDISVAGDLQARLVRVLDHGRPLRLDLSRLETVDTAGLQLLVAFAREAAKKDIPVIWQDENGTLRRAAQQLGMTSYLAMPD